MIINHNMQSINAHRQMGTNAANAQKSMEKLSSGLRINRAGDDAAGLAISEKMRGQIRGLDQAGRNAQDGISLIQTAEGALNETHSILQRMRELGVQSANDTNTDEDRIEIQKEIEQLTEEIDRIGNTTEFNTKSLLDGSVAGGKVAGTDNASVIGNAVGKETAASVKGAAEVGDLSTLAASPSLELKIDGATIKVNLDKNTYSALKSPADDAATTKVADQLEKDINAAIAEYNKANGKEIKDVNVGIEATKKLTLSSGSEGATSTVEVVDGGAATSASRLLGLTTTANVSTTGLEGTLSAGGAGSLDALKTSIATEGKFTLEIDGKKIAIDLDKEVAFKALTFTAGMDMSTIATALQDDINSAIGKYNLTVPEEEQVKGVKVGVKDGSFVVESGSKKDSSSVKFDNSEASKLLGLAGQSSTSQGGGIDFQIGANQKQTINIAIGDMRAEALGVSKLDLSKKDGAQDAIKTIDSAIKNVSAQRSNLGSVQNRLEHTINNLGTSSENLTAAESRIRDIDMAKEMMTMSKNNILSQAAQAMLAQANQAPQQVLQLLR